MLVMVSAGRPGIKMEVSGNMTFTPIILSQAPQAFAFSQPQPAIHLWRSASGLALPRGICRYNSRKQLVMTSW